MERHPAPLLVGILCVRDIKRLGNYEQLLALPVGRSGNHIQLQLTGNWCTKYGRVIVIGHFFMP